MIFDFFKKESKEVADKSLQERIDLSLQKALQDKRTAEQDIKKLRDWAQDAIIDVYSEFFPNAHLTFYRVKYKETALESFDEIKQKYASKLSEETVLKCDNIVDGYKNQIALRQSKLELYDKLIAEYSEMKKKMSGGAGSSVGKMDKLSQHTQRLRDMETNTSDLANTMTESYKLENLQKEVELKEEYLKQLELLSNKYGDETSFKNSLAYKEEVDKMISDLDKK